MAGRVSGTTEADAGGDLFEHWLAEAVRIREQHQAGASLLTRDGATPELTRMGAMRWYLHPALTGTSTQSLYVHELTLPAGSRSGRMRVQGGIIHFVLEGSGHTVVDGRSHSWEADDVIALPIREAGVVYQHVNDGDAAARLLVVWPNLDSALGPEAGVELTVLEDCPEYGDGSR